jgi:hypothetical protein
MTSPDEILMVNMGGSSGGRNDLILKRIKGAAHLGAHL